MAARKIPAWPKGVAGSVWANKLANASTYAIESDVINYDTGTAVRIFSIPEDTILWAIGLEVVTAFDKPNGTLVVRDTEIVLATFGGYRLEPGWTGFVELPVFKRYARFAGGGAGANPNAAPGKMQRELQVDVNGGTGTAGIARVWIKIKPNRADAFRKDYS